MPKTSPAERPKMVIVALSGRSLADAARASGYRPLVADFFGDLDTRAIADSVEVIRGGFDRGMRKNAVLRVLDRLWERDAIVVYGSGFEGRLDALAAIERKWPVAGNDAATIATLKRPLKFASLCKSLGIPHPEVRRGRPSSPRGWLRKRIGGSGGVHVRPAETAHAGGRDVYYQRRIDGEAISVAFLADGRTAEIVGYTRQWADPAPTMPYRYGGAVRIDASAVPHREEMDEAVRKLAAIGLKGLNGADFLVTGQEGAWLLEINPRPGASLDVLRDRGGRLVAAHVEACAGKLPRRALVFDGFRAAAIVFASCTVSSVPELAWPEWTADRQQAGTRVGTDEPLCTVLAEAESADAARALVMERGREIAAVLEGSE